jgi:anti-sigma factor (TIGR02949 family)
MTCREVIEKLGEYLDAELTPAALKQLEAHLTICAPCRAYLATYRRTRELASKVNRVAMPEEVRRRLRALLVDRIRNTS